MDFVPPGRRASEAKGGTHSLGRWRFRGRLEAEDVGRVFEARRCEAGVGRSCLGIDKEGQGVALREGAFDVDGIVSGDVPNDKL